MIPSAGDYISFLDLYNAKRQADAWGTAWDNLIRQYKTQSPENLFVSLHATYFRKNRFFSVIDPNRIRELEPDMIITIIDDAHECWERIRAREILRPRGTNLRLRDIFLWRTVEIMVGDFLTHGLEIPHYVVAAKHPCETLRRLIFEPSIKRIYASFPISSTRSRPERRGQVDEFRMMLHNQFTVFDPLTIDERTLVSSYESRVSGDNFVEIQLGDRWPTGFHEEFESMADPIEESYPIRIPVDQIEEAIGDIDRQIEARDYRLIDQVEAVAAFRPDYGRHHSRGVAAELLYAAQTAGIPVHLTWLDDEDGPYADSPFGSVGTKHSNVDELIAALEA